MKSRLRTLAGVAGTLAVVSGSLVAAGPAFAATPTEPDPANQLGTISLLDAQGAPVTGGLIGSSPNAEYAVASTDDPQSANVKAALYGYAAKSGTAPGAWGGEQLSSSTAFPNSTGPTAVTGTTHPVVWLNKPVTSGTGTSPAQYINFAQLQQDFTNAGDPYAGIYQLRIKTANNTKWWAADIQISGNTWQQIFPAAAQKTATSVSLTASPSTSEYRNRPVALTAAVSGGGAGTVAFRDGTNNITGCDSQPVNSAGNATCTTSSLRAGTRSLTATYTPTDTATYQPSTSSTLSYTIKDAPVVTSGPAVGGSARVGGVVGCYATADDPNAAHSSTWMVNGQQVAAGDYYGIGEQDYGKAVTCAITFSNPAGASGTATSDPVSVGVGPNLRVRRSPVIAGKPFSGARLVVKGGSWTPSATSYAYQWYVNGRAVKRANRAYFSVPKRSRGKVVSVRIVAKRRGYADGVTALRIKIRK